MNETENATENRIEKSDFEQFLEQFPEADAEAVVEGAVKNGDFKKGGLTREYVRSLKEKIAALEEENCSEEAVLSKAKSMGKVTEAIICDYLKKISEIGKAASPRISGAAPSLPPASPKSISEAGALAGDIFKNS